MLLVLLLEAAVERELDPTALLHKIYERISTILIIRNPEGARDVYEKHSIASAAFFANNLARSRQSW